MCCMHTVNTVGFSLEKGGMESYCLMDIQFCKMGRVLGWMYNSYTTMRILLSLQCTLTND